MLVTGAGPIGLLAALMGAQRGLEVHVLDRATEGAKPEAVNALGARYHSGEITDVSKESRAGRGGGVHRRGRARGRRDAAHGARRGRVPHRRRAVADLSLDVGALNNELVLENDVVFGSVNANRRHFEQAVRSLRDADPDWLRRLITRTVPLDRWPEALEKGDDDIKVVVQFSQR